MLSLKYKIIIATSILVVIGFFIFSLAQANRKNLEVDVLDVGQGDSILIKTQYGQNILIDGGPDSSVIKRLGENLPWWDRTIDLIVLTHPHDDHVTGEIDVLKRYQVKKILYTGVVHTAPNYLAWLNLIKENNIPLLIIDHPQTITLGENLSLEIIYPRHNLAGESVGDLNDSSIVARLINSENRFLFMGDASVNVEQELIKTGIDLSADVLKIGHHGSDTATSQEFLDIVKPKIAIIPVGKDNQFGHPSLRTINKLERFGAEILRTDLNGTVKLVSDGQSLSVNN